MKSTKIYKISDKILKLFKKIVYFCPIYGQIRLHHTKFSWKCYKVKFIDRKLSKFLQINVDRQHIFNINLYDDL